MKFLGLQPWPERIPVIECLTAEGNLIDLHNFCRFSSIRLEQDLLVMVFSHDPLEAERKGFAGYTRVQLLFSGLDDLHLEQESGLVEEQFDEFEGIEWTESGDKGTFLCEVGLYTVRFLAQSVKLVLEQPGVRK